MSLTLRLLSQTLSAPLAATIFSPSDAAFVDSGQPTLSLVKFHFSPQALSFRSLPFGAAIPTMLDGRSLFVTTSAADGGDRISINNVTVAGSPIYSDGSLIVFGIKKFFDPDFLISASVPSPSPDLGCVLSPEKPRSPISPSSFRDAIDLLRSMKYSVMASFLELQLLGFHDRPWLTVLAPPDNALLQHMDNFTEYPSQLFLRHILPCKLDYRDLVGFGDGRVLLVTSLEGFNINVTTFGGNLFLNRVEVIDGDMYSNDWFVVHGLAGVLTVPEQPEQQSEAPSEIGRRKFEIPPDRSEF